MKILSVVGTRPNFMKIAPIARALARSREGVTHLLVHTEQHYDARMSASFFDDLGIPNPDFNLGVGSGSHSQQTAAVMMKIEPILSSERPDLVIVVGDVNSTLAAALAAKKLDLRVAHVEAGLRSYDRTMPEEINRLCTDAISDILFTTDRLATQNLRREGASEDKIHFVGNVMIDSLVSSLDRAKKRAVMENLGLSSGGFATLTLHRPGNVDDPKKLVEILGGIREGLPGVPIVFPVHPRTRARVEAFGLSDLFSGQIARGEIYMTDPLGYLDFLSLNCHARLVLTDSGGLQEESTFLGVPCVTLRENTERPITVSEGTDCLAGTAREGIVAAIKQALSMAPGSCRRPEYWDGHAADRIVDVVLGTRDPS